MRPQARTFVALDTADRTRALGLAQQLAGHVGGFKVGLEAFVSCGPSIVREIGDLGHAVFLDLKLHDIPNTVAGAAASAARLGVSFLTVHALGGSAMVEAAVAACREHAPAGAPPPVVLAVTILTSHDEPGLARLGIDGPASSAVARLAALASASGAGGIVCSPLEISEARRAHPHGVLMIPGIRPAGSSRGVDDQARVASPAAAIRAGADRIVVGRPITEAADPVAAAEAIAEEIARG